MGLGFRVPGYGVSQGCFGDFGVSFVDVFRGVYDILEKVLLKLRSFRFVSHL